jgi:hypothetical protein
MERKIRRTLINRSRKAIVTWRTYRGKRSSINLRICSSPKRLATNPRQRHSRLLFPASNANSDLIPDHVQLLMSSPLFSVPNLARDPRQILITIHFPLQSFAHLDPRPRRPIRVREGGNVPFPRPRKAPPLFRRKTCQPDSLRDLGEQM